MQFTYIYLRGRLSSFRNAVVVHDIEIGLHLLKFKLKVIEEKSKRLRFCFEGLKLSKLVSWNKVLCH